MNFFFCRHLGFFFNLNKKKELCCQSLMPLSAFAEAQGAVISRTGLKTDKKISTSRTHCFCFIDQAGI